MTTGRSCPTPVEGVITTLVVMALLGYIIAEYAPKTVGGWLIAGAAALTITAVQVVIVYKSCKPKATPKS